MGLELVELVMTLEEEFKVDIPDAVAQTLTTPRKVYEWLIHELRADNSQAIPFGRTWTPEQVIERTREIIRVQFGITKFNDDDSFVEDLGIDRD
jgi:acyl carrier protein